MTSAHLPPPSLHTNLLRSMLRFGNDPAHPVSNAKTAPDMLTLTTPQSPPAAASTETEPEKRVNSDTFTVKTPSGKTLTLRRWWPLGTDPGNIPAKGPAVLIIPGYGGRTGWAAPLAEKILARHPLIYGLNLSCFDGDLTQRTPLKHTQDLLDEIKEGVEWVKKSHDGPVRLVSTSLGALAATHVVAKNPNLIDGLVLIAPAYRAAQNYLSPSFYLKTLVQKGMALLGLGKAKTISITSADLVQPDNLPKQIKRVKQDKCVLNAGLILMLLKLAYMGVFAKVKQIKVPTLMVVPGKDRMCSPDAMRNGFNKLTSTDKEMVEFPDARHNLVMEAEMLPLADKISQWLDRQTGQNS